MGLMVCQKLVQQNGGTISAKSKGENRGTVISFTMNMKMLQKSSSKSVSSPDVGCTKLIEQTSFSSLCSDPSKKNFIAAPKLLVKAQNSKLINEE